MPKNKKTTPLVYISSQNNFGRSLLFSPCLPGRITRRAPDFERDKTNYVTKTTAILLSLLQSSHPDRFSLYQPYQEHDSDENKEERAQETEQCHPLGTIKFFHRTLQPFRNYIHTWYYE